MKVINLGKGGILYRIEQDYLTFGILDEIEEQVKELLARRRRNDHGLGVVQGRPELERGILSRIVTVCRHDERGLICGNVAGARPHDPDATRRRCALRQHAWRRDPRGGQQHERKGKEPPGAPGCAARARERIHETPETKKRA